MHRHAHTHSHTHAEPHPKKFFSCFRWFFLTAEKTKCAPRLGEVILVLWAEPEEIDWTDAQTIQRESFQDGSEKIDTGGHKVQHNEAGGSKIRDQFRIQD